MPRPDIGHVHSANSGADEPEMNSGVTSSGLGRDCGAVDAFTGHLPEQQQGALIESVCKNMCGSTSTMRHSAAAEEPRK